MAKVSAAVVWFDFSGTLTDDGLKAESEGIGDAFDRWLTLFWNWVEALNGVSYLDPNSRRDKHQIQLRGWMKGGYSQANITSIDTIAIVGLKAASAKSLKEAGWLASQGKEVPLEHHFLSEARGALRIGDRRLAVLDAATAGELALTNTIDRALSTSGLAIKAQSVVQSGFRMLGSKVRLAASLGLELPEGINERLVAPRNRIIHAGAEVEQKKAADAVKASSELIHALSPLKHYLKAE